MDGKIIFLQTDVLIIGSGPAGCAAAIGAAMQGYKTLLIAGREEEQPVIETAQPSESLHPGVLTLLEQLHAAQCIEVALQGIYEGIEVNGEYNPLGADETGPWQGYHVNRKLFDHALLQSAIGQGVAIIYNELVTGLLVKDERVTGVHTNTGKQISATYTVDASGQKRVAGKELRFTEIYNSPPLLAYTGIAEHIPANASLFERKATQFIPNKNGWLWLAPENDGRCTFTRLEVKGNRPIQPPAMLEAYTDVSKIKAYNRRWRVFRPVCREGILLCGDAAGIIDPAAGQGVLNALMSAVMVVRTIKACTERPMFEALFLAQYDDWFISEYQDRVNRLKQFYKQHGIEKFFSS